MKRKREIQDVFDELSKSNDGEGSKIMKKKRKSDGHLCKLEIKKQLDDLFSPSSSGSRRSTPPVDPDVALALPFQRRLSLRSSLTRRRGRHKPADPKPAADSPKTSLAEPFMLRRPRGVGRRNSIARADSVVKRCRQHHPRSIKLKKPLMSLRGSMRSKLSAQIRRNLMKGKQDYALPLSVTLGQQDFMQFLSAMQSTPDHLKDDALQQKMDYEIKMRDGTAKLLAASRHPAQMLEAAKNLLTSNTRMLAYMAELQTRKTAEVMGAQQSPPPPTAPAPPPRAPCPARLALSDVRIPLMWPRGHGGGASSRRQYAAFCLVTVGTDIADTSLLTGVDAEMTDLCFDDILIFTDVPANFTVKFEVFCHRLCDDFTSSSSTTSSSSSAVSSTPRKIKKKINELSNSVGRNVGKRLSGLKDDPEFMANMLVGPKFDVIGRGELRVADVSDYVQTYDLAKVDPAAGAGVGAGGGELPLFGNFCCRLAAQPVCMLHGGVSGQLTVQAGDSSPIDYFCCVRRQQICCFASELDSSINSAVPQISIPLNKESHVSYDAEMLTITVTFRDAGKRLSYQLTAPGEEEFTGWREAITQLEVDRVGWGAACDSLMDIKPASPHRVPVFLRKGNVSLYDDTECDSPMTRILNRLNVADDSPVNNPSDTQPTTNINIPSETQTLSNISTEFTTTAAEDQTPLDNETVSVHNNRTSTSSSSIASSVQDMDTEGSSRPHSVHTQSSVETDV